MECTTLLRNVTCTHLQVRLKQAQDVSETKSPAMAPQLAKKVKWMMKGLGDAMVCYRKELTDTIRL